MANTVVFIPGAFAGSWCFADLVPAFAARGFACHTPDLRYHVPGPQLPPDPRLAGTRIADYTADMAEYIRGLPEKPVIVGHPMGGLIAQQLAARGLARALVLLAPAAPWGVLPATATDRAVATGLMMAWPFADKALQPSFEVARNDSLASLAPDAQARVFGQFSAESGQALFELFFWMFDGRCTTAVDTAKVDVPVLVIAGSDDKVISSATGRNVAQLYAGRSTFHELPGRGHFLVLEPGSAEVAQRCVDWLAQLDGAAVAPVRPGAL
jgi:pimeloyl-ACP methyl ester carboxylesterase